MVTTDTPSTPAATTSATAHTGTSIGPSTGASASSNTDLHAQSRDIGPGTIPTDPSSVSLHHPFVGMTHEQLSPEDSQKETDRAAETINRKIKPLSKLSAVRQNIATAFQESDEDSKATNDNTDSDRNTPSPSPPDNVLLTTDITSASVPTTRTTTTTTETGDPGAGARTALLASSSNVDPHQPPESTLSRLGYTKSKKPPKKKSNLIEIEPPRLIDAQSARDDPRYFQLPSDPPPEGDFVYDFLYQHQRGAFFLGTPKFSSKSLLPVDPDEWTDSRFETSVMNTTDYVLPDPNWEWVHKSWLVDMTGDVDEDGWEYAMTFHGSPWHGNYETFRSFARRRRWLRLRKRKGKMGRSVPLPERVYPSSINSATWTKLDLNLDEPSPFPTLQEEESRSNQGAKGNAKGGTSTLAPPVAKAAGEPVDLYKILKKARSDREKLAYTSQYVVRYPGDFDDLEARMEKYLKLFEYEASKREFLALFATYGRTTAVQMGSSNLEYYSDRKKLSHRTK